MSVKTERQLSIFGGIVSLSWLLFVIIAFSDAGSGFLAFSVLFFGGLLWSIVWMARFIVWIIYARRESTSPISRRHAAIYWGIEPATLALSAVLLFSGVLVRFRLSSSALNVYVDDVKAGRVSASGRLDTPRKIGLYSITETELLTNGVVRIITSTDGFDDAGFVFSPTSSPPVIGEDSYKHIAGAWWHWHRSW